MWGLAPCQQDLRMNAGTALLARTSIKRGDTPDPRQIIFNYFIVCRLVVPSSVLMILMM